jgi:hypothetical protein
MRTLLLSVSCFLFCTAAAATAVPTPSVSVPALDAQHERFAKVLAASVRGKGVDYAALKQSPDDLNAYLAQIAAAKAPKDRAERLAFYINAYNATTLALVLRLLPEKESSWAGFSVMKVDGFWKKFTFEVAGERLTIDQIQHNKLKPLGEPRIHFAINCASVSCPPLAAKTYLAATIEAQLEAAATGFVADTEQVRTASGKLVGNPILEWYAGDFGGPKGVIAFLAERSSGDRQKVIKRGGLKTFEYDWNLNRSR